MARVKLKEEWVRVGYVKSRKAFYVGGWITL